jgi:hypothetical protein
MRKAADSNRNTLTLLPSGKLKFCATFGKTPIGRKTRRSGTSRSELRAFNQIVALGVKPYRVYFGGRIFSGWTLIVVCQVAGPRWPCEPYRTVPRASCIGHCMYRLTTLIRVTGRRMYISASLRVQSHASPGCGAESSLLRIKLGGKSPPACVRL